MRMKLRVSKTGHTWHWFYEDWDAPHPDRIHDAATEDYPDWPVAEAAGRAAHPDAPDVVINAVRGTGTDYPDSRPTAHRSRTPR